MYSVLRIRQGRSLKLLPPDISLNSIFFLPGLLWHLILQMVNNIRLNFETSPVRALSYRLFLHCEHPEIRYFESYVRSNT